MINLFGFQIPLPPEMAFLATPLSDFIVNLAAWIIIAILIDLVVMRLLKLVTRSIPGDLEDIVLGIVRHPIIILIVLFGFSTSIKLLEINADAAIVIRRIGISILVLVIAHVLGRIIKDVLVYYGEQWAQRTESQVDDVIVPVFRLFGPIVLVIIAALIILPLWGVDVSSVLLGAGVLGLVLGLALQETLGNIFSGLSLLIEAPFRKGDLIQLDGNRVCEVQQLGLRSTTLFSLEKQATIYMPNKILAANPLVNLTKPTSEQRFNIKLSVDQKSNLVHVKDMIERVAKGHPAVLTSNISSTLPLYEDQIAHIRLQAAREDTDPAAREILLREAEANERSLARLALEGKLNAQLQQFKESVRTLIRGIKARELRGLDESERLEILDKFIEPITCEVVSIKQLAKEWSEQEDGWLSQHDYWMLRRIWENRNEQLDMRWKTLVNSIQSPDDRIEMRLDDIAADMIKWLDKDYKIVPGNWKDPVISITGFDGCNVELELAYYVDNIRLENDSRPQRVRTELSRIIREKLVDEGIWCG